MVTASFGSAQDLSPDFVHVHLLAHGLAALAYRLRTPGQSTPEHDRNGAPAPGLGTSLFRHASDLRVVQQDEVARRLDGDPVVLKQPADRPDPPSLP